MKNYKKQWVAADSRAAFRFKFLSCPIDHIWGDR